MYFTCQFAALLLYGTNYIVAICGISDTKVNKLFGSCRSYIVSFYLFIALANQFKRAP
jgi:hypothetical protein